MALLGFGGRGQVEDEWEDDGPDEPTDEDPEALLRSAPFVSYRLHEGNEALQIDGDHLPRVVPGFFAEVLAHCRSFADLDEHVDRVAAAFGLGRTETTPLRASLAEAAESGLLVSLDAVYRRAVERSSDASASPAISTMGLVTHDRATHLARALRSWMEAARTHGRRPDFVVCDDSSDPGQRAQGVAEAQRLGRELGFEVWYAGPDEKEAYAAALAEELGAGVPDAIELARFGLLGAADGPCTIGANRNTLALHCSGEVYATADDDVVCQLARTPEAHAGLELSSLDPTGFWFYRSVAEAVSGARFEDVDPWAEHERLLGRGLDDVIASQPGASSLVLDGMGDSLFRTVLSGGGTVRVTSTGLVGDSGMGSASYLLLLGGESLERLEEDLDAYELARSTRAVFRAAPGFTVSDASHLMGSALAMDARALLPPFMPVLRSEDGIFVDTMRLCMPDALVGHLPWAARHEPPEERAFAEDEVITSVSAFRGAEYVVRWSRQRAFGPGERDPELRLRSLGQHLQTLGSLPARDFAELLAADLWRHLSDVSMILERRLESGQLPQDMAEDTERSLEHIEGRITEARPPAPVDFLEGRSPAEAADRFATVVRDYGRLLDAWPAVVEAAGALKQRGVRPARRLG